MLLSNGHCTETLCEKNEILVSEVKGGEFFILLLVVNSAQLVSQDRFYLFLYTLMCVSVFVCVDYVCVSMSICMCLSVGVLALLISKSLSC